MTTKTKTQTLSAQTLWLLQNQLTVAELKVIKSEILQHRAITNPKARLLLAQENAAGTKATNYDSYNLLSYWDLETLLNGRDLTEIPLAISARGNTEILNAPRVAIIGSRHPTYYGREQAHRFAKEIARAGITVVSGGAIGIDTIANQGAFETGNSCAVLGSGLDVPYPTTNSSMFERFSQSKNGLVLSEFPLASGAAKWNFPRRNITIAALADFLLVIEATATSGSMLTVNAASEMNCDVGAIPGPIDSATSEGTNMMIRDGAFCILRPSDVIERAMSIAAFRMGKAVSCKSAMSLNGSG